MYVLLAAVSDLDRGEFHSTHTHTCEGELLYRMRSNGLNSRGVGNPAANQKEGNFTPPFGWPSLEFVVQPCGAVAVSSVTHVGRSTEQALQLLLVSVGYIPVKYPS